MNIYQQTKHTWANFISFRKLSAQKTSAKYIMTTLNLIFVNYKTRYGILTHEHHYNPDGSWWIKNWLTRLSTKQLFLLESESCIIFIRFAEQIKQLKFNIMKLFTFRCLVWANKIGAAAIAWPQSAFKIIIYIKNLNRHSDEIYPDLKMICHASWTIQVHWVVVNLSNHVKLKLFRFV